MTKRFLSKIALILCFTLYACSTIELTRKPSGTVETVAPPSALVESIRSLRKFIESDEFNGTTCGTRLNSLQEELFALPANQLGPVEAGGARYAHDELIQVIWETRLELRKRFGELVSQGTVTPECEAAVRRAFNVTRFLEEYIAVRKLGPPAPDPNHLMPTWSGEFPYKMKAPGVSEIDFRSGDILLSRGDAFTSAAIARVGDVEGQFSHLALVYVDPITGKKFAVQSKIETGVVVTPFEQYLSDGKVRSTLYRYPDADVAARAAKIMYDKANRAIQNGANIPYDFKFDINDSSEVFCAELAEIGYREASDGRVLMPLFPSKITKKHREFLDSISMKVTSTFAPMDMEVDTRFEMLAEWRDLSRTHETQAKDAVFTKMYEWMESYHYVLGRTFGTRVKGEVLWNIRRWSIFSGLLNGKFPENMPKSALEATFSLSQVGEGMFGEVVASDYEFHDRTGTWMTQKNMQDALERVRIEDFSRWEQWETWRRSASPYDKEHKLEPPKPIFHSIFRPADTY